MPDDNRPDAVILEDRPDEIGRIHRWLLIEPTNVESKLIKQSDGEGELLSDGDDPLTAVVLQSPGRETQIATMKRQVAQQVKEHDPCIVIVDWLLSGESGEDPFSGFDIAALCKEKWPDMGVVLVTTGGDDDMALLLKNQMALDDSLSRVPADSRPDYAWIKPWGPSARLDLAFRGDLGIPHRTRIRDLLEGSKRPSEH